MAAELFDVAEKSVCTRDLFGSDIKAPGLMSPDDLLTIWK